MEFKSWNSYSFFAYSTQHQARYVHPPATVAFLEAVGETSQNRSEIIPGGTLLWRAQIGHEIESNLFGNREVPLPPERMKPRQGLSLEGRANPKGIPCLYLATDHDTAMAEVRPRISEFVSVGEFEIQNDLTVVNCTTEDRPAVNAFEMEEPPAPVRERYVWAEIDRAFAQPVRRTDTTADYVPTQMIAELFKVRGLNGLIYGSSLGPGRNIALFDLRKAELIGCSLYQLRALSYRFYQVPPSIRRITKK